jgi:hypothetical protein
VRSLVFGTILPDELNDVIVRDFAVGIFYIKIAMFTVFFLFMAKDWINARRTQLKTPLIPGWMAIYLSLIIISVVYLITDVYLGPLGLTAQRNLILNISYTISMLGIVLLVAVFERNLKMKTWGIFWKVGVILTLITIFLPRDPSRYILSISVPSIFVPFMFLLLYHFRKLLLSSTGVVIWMMFFGFMVGSVGEIFQTDAIVAVAGDMIYLFGGMLNLVGLVVLGVSSLSLRSLDELEWPSAVMKLFVILQSSGLPIYSFDFEKRKALEKKSVESEAIIAGGLSGIRIMLKELSKSSADVNYIDHGDFTIIFTHGEQVTVILFSKKYLDLLKWKIDRLLRKIESIYEERIVNYDGDYAKFRGISTLLEEEFA